MKPISITLALFALLGVKPYESLQEPPQEPVIVEQQESTQTVEKPVKKVQDKPNSKSEEELRLELTKANPKGCDRNTEYILWPDGECKAREIVERVASSVSTPLPVSCESYRHLVTKYSWDVETMMYAMRKESGCNTNAVGDNYVIGGVYAPSCGLLQVRTLPGRPSCDELKDPAKNIATAYQIWLSQGYGAWSVLH